MDSIIIVEDDKDDQDIYEEAITSLGIPHLICLYDDGETGLAYLYATKEKPFSILSAINMVQMDGYNSKKRFKMMNI